MDALVHKMARWSQLSSCAENKKLACYLDVTVRVFRPKRKCLGFMLNMFP